jgi:CO/xanthine dehydrogenase FAD-binding subunit
MIEAYRRPETLVEALDLLSSTELRYIPIGGGSAVNRYSRDPFGVVDLQDLGLNSFIQRGNFIDLGATLTLQSILDIENIQPALKKAVRLEAAYNLRNIATVAGSLVSADGRSTFATAMLALDSSLSVQPGDEQVPLGELLALRQGRLSGRLITAISLPVNVDLAYASVGRSPADLPIVCAAVALWPSGRIRAALGGWGSVPLLAMDGPDSGGLETAARDAYSQAGDEWASAEYRQDVAAVLVQRCHGELLSGGSK